MKLLKDYLFEFLNSVDKTTITKVIKKYFGKDNVFAVTSKLNNDVKKALVYLITIKDKSNYSEREQPDRYYDDIFNDLSNKLQKYNYDISADVPEISQSDGYLSNMTINWLDEINQKDFVDAIKKYNEKYKLNVLNKKGDFYKNYDEFLKVTGKKYAICVEPIYGDDVTDYIKTKCNNKLYHITTQKNYEKNKKIRPNKNTRILIR